jgi:hypothetical protein
MNIRSILNKGLLLIPAVLVAPLLTVASPTTVCTAFGASSPTLDANSTVSLAEGGIFNFEAAVFTCPGVVLNTASGTAAINDPGLVFSDFVRWSTVGSGLTAITTILFSSDNFLCTTCELTTPATEGSVVLPGSFFSGTTSKPIKLTFASDNGAASPISDTVTASITPEPGSMLLFGTGLLIVGGFVRRRLLAQTPGIA